MSKAFTREDATEDAEAESSSFAADVAIDLDDEAAGPPVPPDKNYMTPASFAALQAELRFLLKEERPRITEIVSWAAGNGDRSENGDYLYNKKRLREIDRRIRYLTKRLDKPVVVDPRQQQGIDRVFFGATVTYVRADNTEMTVQLVGIDEADVAAGKINWLSPVGRALMKARGGDEVVVRPTSEVLEVTSVAYVLPED